MKKKNEAKKTPNGAADEIAELKKEIRSLKIKLGRALKAAQPDSRSNGKEGKKTAKRDKKPMTDKQIESSLKKAPKRLAPGTFYNADELSLNVGLYSIKAMAEKDAMEFKGNPGTVFFYRSVLFPDPRRFNVQPTVIRTEVVPFPSKSTPWALRVVIEMSGSDDVHRKAWASGVMSRCKSYQEAANAR